jgi:hypothetical protein
MAEIKNSFLSSKMNKDLDDRLLPSGQYRDALNISVGKSENSDIGALQNVLGNIKITPETNPDLECIGYFMDNQNNRIFQFLTDYIDPSPNNITYPTSGTMKITMCNFNDPASYVTLVEGLFLNFAKNNEFSITGVNLIEGLLFWTDNRNQPRKINVANALNTPGYYTTEEQISVAKYAPVDPITMYRKASAIVTDASTSPVLYLTNTFGIVPGMTVISENITGAEYITVAGVFGTTITLYEAPTTPIVNGDELTFLISTMSDKSDVPTWPGDPVFLEDKYVRFSYRFKYDDNEYSLMAPFTQIAYIPKQKGYFIAGNETDAYRSTILNWFENNINNIELVVPFPDKVGSLADSYKITEVDILYKESDSLVVSVFETIPISSINTPINTNNNYYIQPYQSQKPYKTLPEAQTIRVYDKVPVRARAQELSGNRVIYGNYFDKYTCLSSINYNLSIQPKSPQGTNFIEYPNHTLKKNRNYQVGFVLADKFGRQSSVILSTVDLISPSIGGGEYARGSTIYSGYNNNLLFEDVRSWFGDALILYLNSPINQDKYIPSGQPGLYAIPTSNSGFAITASTITNTTYTYTLDITAALNTPPVEGNIMRGFHTDYVKVLSNPVPTANPNEYTITTSGRVGDIYKYTLLAGGVKDIKFSYEYNPIGWYSYKIVVKQQEQDYYNVYLPGMLNGYPKNQTSGSQVVYSGSGATATSTLENGINITQFPVSETGNTAHIVLINDNINKVPSDLSEVGPDQRQYRSSVQLYGRVENTEATVDIIGEIPAYSAKVTTITYDTTTVGQGDWILIKPGDGIQCVEANAPIPNPDPLLGGTVPNPYRWLGDTVVVSNEIVGTTGTIVISSPNWILQAAQDPNGDNYINFIITRAENKQYFPTRKADTVIAIAAANEFNFLSNSQDNLSGTAGLNFYQLQNSPKIGRVSTINKIGVVASDMIPFLSVYETRPVQSLLELFWETATTGLISDLNTDVLTGFEGPSRFEEVNYTQFEHQNPNGTDLDPNNQGEANSKYITSEFYVVNQNGFLLPNTTVTLLSIIDGNGNSRLADFDIESMGGSPSVYRLYIKNPFVFNNNAGTAERYVFTFNVVDLDNPSTASQLTIAGRLGNNNPIITTEETNYNITQDTTSIVTLEANNGSFSLAETGLKWAIVSGDTTIPSFNITPYTGELSLINDQVPIGVYNLVIRVQDAVNTDTGAILLPEATNFGTKSDTITLTINVGDDPVNYWLRPDFQSSSAVTGNVSCGSVTPITPKYGMVYIGKNATPNSSYMPVVPGSGSVYQFIDNVEVINASGYGVNPIIPTGLTQGEYRFEVELTVPPPALCDVELGIATIRASAEIYLYKRIYNASTPNPWALVNNENNYGIPTPIYTIGQLVVNTSDDGSGPVYQPTQVLTTSFAIAADGNPDISYEYAVGIKLIQSLTNTDDTFPFVTIYGRDANYTYSVPPALPVQPFSPPITTSFSYFTGIEEYSIVPPGETSAVPYLTQDAAIGTIYNSPTNTVGSGTILPLDESVELILATPNEQIVPGLSYIFTSLSIPPFNGFVTGINVDGNPSKIALQLFSPYSGTVPGDLAGGNISASTVSQTNPPSIGRLYANTEEGTEIKRFYTDSALTQKWIPPVADRFYNFQTSKNYNPGNVVFGTSGPLRYSNYPYYSAKFNAEGEVISQIAPTPNIETAWVGQNNNNNAPLPIANYSYNVYYEIIT